MSHLSQEQKILAYLKDGHTLTPLEALNKYGCFRLAARINALCTMYGQFPKAKRKRPMWTKEKPTVNGWYWFRPTDPVSIKIDPMMCWPVEFVNSVMYENGNPITWHVEGEYQGPINPVN